jgi:DNA-binding LacI/PurR family transcriptional regulator
MNHVRAVTLEDVAREAGVAVSTVSRALSNPDRVSSRTREHVRAVAQRMDYHPNRLAQGLPSGRTRMLALLVSDITNPHQFGLIRGAEAQAAAAGYTVLLADGRGRPELEAELAAKLGSSVDGFVLASSRRPDAELVELAARRPLVLFNRELAGFPSVVTDNADGSRQVVEHLVALGHRSLAYLGGPRNAWSEGQRWDALAADARNAGVEIVRLGPFPATLEGGVGGADVGLASGATALVAFNDLMAIGVLRRLEQRGVAVPSAISVVGYDDIFGADFCHPPLTTVASPVEDAGRALVDLLLGDQPAQRVILPTELRIRASTGPPQGESGISTR